MSNTQFVSCGTCNKSGCGGSAVPFSIIATLDSVKFRDFVEEQTNCFTRSVSCLGVTGCTFAGGATAAFGGLVQGLGLQGLNLTTAASNPFCLFSTDDAGVCEDYVSTLDIEVDSLSCAQNCYTLALAQQNRTCGSVASTPMINLADVVSGSQAALNLLCSTCEDFTRKCKPSPQVALAKTETIISEVVCVDEEDGCCECERNKINRAPVFKTRTKYIIQFVTPEKLSNCCFQCFVVDCNTQQVLACTKVNRVPVNPNGDINNA
jgi:hypothetical protein